MANELKAGLLFHQVMIEKPKAQKDSLNRSTGWDTFASSVAAHVEDLSGRQTFTAGRIMHEVTHVVRMRFLSGLSNDMRVIWNGKTLDIEGILQPDGKLIEHQLLCSEVTA